MLILYFSNYIMKKDIIFYSNFCTYSKEIINQISKTPINDNILYVCVDDENIQLPNFIKAVPTIYLANQKRIVVDESIPKWIEEQLSQSFMKMEEMQSKMDTQMQTLQNSLPKKSSK